MDEHGPFDLAAFCVAIEQRDAAAQLGFYAPDAEIELIYRRDPAETGRTITGGADVIDWIRQRCAEPNLSYEVIYHWLEADTIMVTEECRHPDGTTDLTASTGNIVDGRITTQTTVFI